MTDEEKKEMINGIEERIIKRRAFWRNKVAELSKRLKGDVKEIIDLQADVINYRQELVEEMTDFSFDIYKDLPTMKQLHKERFEFYSIKYQVKTNVGERTKLIEADLRFMQAKIDLYEAYISYLKDTIKNFDDFHYSIKNKVAILNILGLE